MGPLRDPHMYLGEKQLTLVNQGKGKFIKIITSRDERIVSILDRGLKKQAYWMSESKKFN